MSFTQQTHHGVTFHTADAFTAAGGVAHGFATRLGGVSTGPYAQLNLGITRPDERAAVRENYHRFCAAIGVDETRLVMTHQVHEDGIRGTSLGIAPKAVAKMTALYGTRPEDVLAAIGPGIGPCCFETHDDVPTALEDRLGPAVRPFCHPLEQAAGKFTVDLKGIIAWELRQAGLAEEHIDTLPLCTACHPELYWSHRKMGDQRGNHAAMIALEG